MRGCPRRIPYPEHAPRSSVIASAYGTVFRARPDKAGDKTKSDRIIADPNTIGVVTVAVLDAIAATVPNAVRNAPTHIAPYGISQ